MYTIWRNKNISLKTKLSLYNSNVISIVLYGSECWPMTVVNTKRIDGFDSKALRRIMNINWQDNVSNTRLREMTNQVELSTRIKRRRLQWFGHVCRIETSKIQRAVLLEDQEVVKRTKGRPKETWYQTLKKDFKQFQMSESDAIAAAMDRDRWRSLVAQCAKGVVGKT